MTHMQIIEMVWQAVAPVAFATLCVLIYFWWTNRPDDHDDGDAPGLLVDVVERLPFGFHTPKGKAA